jgi:predicted secreted protein
MKPPSIGMGVYTETSADPGSGSVKSNYFCQKKKTKGLFKEITVGTRKVI